MCAYVRISCAVYFVCFVSQKCAIARCSGLEVWHDWIITYSYHKMKKIAIFSQNTVQKYTEIIMWLSRKIAVSTVHKLQCNNIFFDRRTVKFRHGNIITNSIQRNSRSNISFTFFSSITSPGLSFLLSCGLRVLPS